MRRVEGRPQVVAHRGSSHEKPEHTLAAYVAALDTGAEGLECDVRLTSDGHLVCVHDRRIDRTTNGSGAVSVMELAELDRLDFASWKLDDEAPEIDEEHRKVLTMQRLLEVVRDYERPVDLAIETKHPTRYAGLVERRLVDLLSAFGLTGACSPARVMSFSPVALTRVKRLALGSVAGCASGADGCTSGPRTRPRTSTSAWLSALRRSSPTTRAAPSTT
jgi:glycerophosphoryl diester phosphodiesterase